MPDWAACGTDCRPCDREQHYLQVLRSDCSSTQAVNACPFLGKACKHAQPNLNATTLSGGSYDAYCRSHLPFQNPQCLGWQGLHTHFWKHYLTRHGPQCTLDSFTGSSHPHYMSPMHDMLAPRERGCARMHACAIWRQILATIEQKLICSCQGHLPCWQAQSMPGVLHHVMCADSCTLTTLLVCRASAFGTPWW